MNRNVLTFANHACFTVQNQSALLLVDPWLEGAAFNDGWRLLDQSTSNTGMVVQLERARLPVYIWYSQEHADHFSVSFVQKLKENFGGKVTFLFRHTLDKRLHGWLRHNAFDVIECAEGVPVALGHDMRITYPPEVWDRVKAKSERNGETITDVLNRALRAYDKRHPDPPKERP